MCVHLGLIDKTW